MPDPITVGAWVGVVVAAGGIIGGSVKFFFWAFDEWKKRKKHEGFSAPSESLRLISKPDDNCWWHMGKKGDEPTMQIVGRIFVTNVASVPIRIPQVELRYGFCGRKRVSGMVMVARARHENMYGMYDIPPGETRDVSFDFWVYPPVAKPTEAFRARSVSFVDQFGNRHKLKSVRFKSTAIVDAPAPKEPEEFPYEISNSIDKEIVSVLKAELGRYEMCGRSVGGLGSVHIIYQGRPMTGVGSDSWTPNSPVNQVIVSNPDAASLKSDNVEALVAFHRQLTSDEERVRFVETLLDRLDANKGYLSISYFIVAVLWRVGSLREVLQKARRDLPAGESKVFGLSNVLMLSTGIQY